MFWVYRCQQCCTCRQVMLMWTLCPRAFHVGLGACPGALCHLGKIACDSLLVDAVLLLLPPRSTADLQAVAAPPALCSQRFPIAAHMACEITRRSVARVAAAASSRVADRTLNFPLSGGRGREFLFFCLSEFVSQSALEISPLPARGGDSKGCRGGDNKAIVLLCSIREQDAVGFPTSRFRSRCKLLLCCWV